ncbi:MAG: hypothetical protein LBC27_06050 [Spirochaetaceae bacterium]|jgi:hypothetical protein|nr:hypothetical protein [Spirochaetaceae bacterium]
MKKVCFIFLISFCSLFFLYAQNDEVNGEESPAQPETQTTGEEPEPISELAEETEDDADKKEAPAKRPFKLPSWMTSEGASLSTGRQETRKTFELGIADITLLTSLKGFNLFEIDSWSGFDPADMKDFNMDIAFFVNPIYFRLPVKNVFVFDFFTGTDITARVNLPEKTISTLKKIRELASGDTPDSISELQNYINWLKNNEINNGMAAGVNAFLEMGIGASKTILNDRLWLRAAPSVFFTLFYMKHKEISLNGYNNSDNTQFGLEGNGSIDLYSAWDLDRTVNPFNSPGVDITLEALYAVWPVLDAGLSISHIPLVPSTLNYRMSLDVSDISMYVDTTDPSSMIQFNMPDVDKMIMSSDNENKQIFRPVRFDLYALAKPFKSPVLIIRPNIGATVNTAFSDSAFFNWGLNIQFNAPKIFSAFIGTGLTEDVWAQRLGLSFNLRFFELDLGAALAGSSFVESWSGQGFIVSIGLKAGF